MKFTIERARCFKEIQGAEIRPLTLLVGENSTGKSSFMALYRIIVDYFSPRNDPSFNRSPYYLGTFDDIAHHRGGSYGRANEFSLGLTTTARLRNKRTRRDSELLGKLTFTKNGSTPRISKFSLTEEKIQVEFEHLENGRDIIQITTPDYSIKETISERGLPPIDYLLKRPSFIRYFLEDIYAENKSKRGLEDIDVASREIASLLSSFSRSVPQFTEAYAPVRSKPLRTYDPIEDAPEADGSHIPQVLARMKRLQSAKWEQTKQLIDRFGQEAGLFNELDVKNLGRSDSAPFQLQVKIEGPKRNITDVGYGVSQVLPILADLGQTRRNTAYLLQQPEVHLHPKAQAALGSFFVRFAKQKPSNVHVVETHSDYLIDRVRSEIRMNNIRAEFVSLLFFERNGLDVTIHNIEIDPDGNLVNAPMSYREFFLEEKRKNLGF